MTARGKRGGAPPRDPGEDPLWRAVTESTRPLKRRERPRTETPPPNKAAKPAKTVKARTAHPARAPAAPPPQGPAPAPASAPLDRRVSQRLARGRRDYDARIDLHGMRRAEAKPALLAFLRRAQEKGDRLVLVITGKGRSAAPGDFMDLAEGGVLRRELPRWLEQAEFRALVAGVAPAPPRHGGEGAFSLHVRRKRQSPRARE